MQKTRNAFALTGTRVRISPSPPMRFRPHKKPQSSSVLRLVSFGGLKMDFDILKVVEYLKNKRKIFISEADFQFEMAWAIKELYPEAKVRLEYCPEFEPSMHIDILVIIDSKWIPIELKYKTKKCFKTIDNEAFILKEHSAKDVNCYLYLKDLQRIEHIKENAPFFEKGYGVFLTNERSYLKEPNKPNCVYKEFSLANGIVKSGIMQWSETASLGTKKGNERPIHLKGTYKIQWNTYSELDESNSGKFFVLINKIE